MRKSRSHYSRADLVQGLRRIGLRHGSTVFSHSNIGFFGRPEGVRSSEELCQLVLDAFFEVLGPEGTLVVPTFTYSFPQGQVFEPDVTPSNCGSFSEFVRKHTASRRSEEPNVSVAAIGPKAPDLTVVSDSYAYGKESFFAKFYRASGVIVNLNFDAGSTFLHYVERELSVPYRYDKTFRGTVCKNGEISEVESTLWVRDLASELTVAAFEAFDRLARESGKFVCAEVGRGQCGLITASAAFELVREALPSRPWLLTRADGTQVSLKLTPKAERA